MIVLKRQKPDNHTILKFLLLIDLLKSQGAGFEPAIFPSQRDAIHHGIHFSKFESRLDVK